MIVEKDSTIAFVNLVTMRFSVLTAILSVHLKQVCSLLSTLNFSEILRMVALTKPSVLVT